MLSGCTTTVHPSSHRPRQRVRAVCTNGSSPQSASSRRSATVISSDPRVEQVSPLHSRTNRWHPPRFHVVIQSALQCTGKTQALDSQLTTKYIASAISIVPIGDHSSPPPRGAFPVHRIPSPVPRTWWRQNLGLILGGCLFAATMGTALYLLPASLGSVPRETSTESAQPSPGEGAGSPASRSPASRP